MIVIVTGAPGSGKSLWTIQEVEKLRQETGRPVYYYNIPGVTLPWHELSDPKEVHKLPQGSIVVVDEAWQPYPNRPAGSFKPEHIEGFATHRHRGHDFYLMTQSSGQVDQFIRGMVGRHVHLERKFGLPRSRTWSWESKLGDPGDWHSKQEATASEFIYPRKFYTAYKSADMHTVKQRMPWFRLGVIGVAIVGALLLIWTVVSSGAHKHKAVTSTAAVQHVDDDRISPGEGRRFDLQFAEATRGEPYSARLYRPKIVAATIPKISGCLELVAGNFKKCVCNTQQGTVIPSLTFEQCHYYLTYGWFDFTASDEEAGQHGARRPSPASASGSSSALATPTQGPGGPGAAAPNPVTSLGLFN